MTETGKVHKLTRGGFAVVRFDRKSACENCNMCFKPKEENYVELRVKNTLQAKVGDSVRIAMGERAVLAASFVVYMIPLAVMAVALGASYQFVGDLYAVLIGVGALLLGFVPVALIDRKLRYKKGYLPLMMGIITDNQLQDGDAHAIIKE